MANCSSSASTLGRPASLCMARRRGPPSQGWKTFLRNHADGVAAMVPTVSFRLLYGLLIMGHRPATNPVARRHSAAHGGMDCQPTDGGLWLGANPSRSDPRSGCLLRQLIRSSRALARHSRSSDFCTLALAERVRGAFGSRVIGQMIGQLKGQARFDWRPEGLVCEIVLQT